ncbi:hypothetical protein AVEN_209967-1 [Araneus ventricosus]|uniref:Uncharacterized protein n=1 Tax=Araneus ventricosus TaxID=182803 RepID=A0A4Y2DBI5_ARAVE|nr:hypothetical protein AVEN_209967-1 [Araneus ventricosus]
MLKCDRYRHVEKGSLSREREEIGKGGGSRFESEGRKTDVGGVDVTLGVRENKKTKQEYEREKNGNPYSRRSEYPVANEFVVCAERLVNVQLKWMG